MDRRFKILKLLVDFSTGKSSSMADLSKWKVRARGVKLDDVKLNGQPKAAEIEGGIETMPKVTDIGTLIVCTPEIRADRPRIAGTGVPVRRIVGWYKLGWSPEEIADRIGHLSLAQVHAALTYYHANQEEIETDIAAE